MRKQSHGWRPPASRALEGRTCSGGLALGSARGGAQAEPWQRPPPILALAVPTLTRGHDSLKVTASETSVLFLFEMNAAHKVCWQRAMEKLWFRLCSVAGHWVTRCPTRVHSGPPCPVTWEGSALKETLSCKPVKPRESLVRPRGLDTSCPPTPTPRLCRALSEWAGTREGDRQMAGVRPLI